MRWQVEVSTVGKDGFEPYTVEADSWQRALQTTRKLRGDDNPMSGFSIELANDGCRAVDPAARVRYDVKRTSDGAPLTPGGQAPPRPAAAKSAPPKSAPPKSAPPKSAPPKSAPRPSGPATAKVASQDSRAAQPVPAASPSSAATDPVLPPSPGSTAKMQVPHDTSAVEWPTAEITFKREEEPTDEVPITYREYAFVLTRGTSEDAAAQALLVQFLGIRKALEGYNAGKLVNLGAFDAPFSGRPPVAPIATLVWKDWQGEPVIAFPRRERLAAQAAPVRAAPAFPEPPHRAPAAQAAPVQAAPVYVAPVPPMAAPVVALQAAPAQAIVAPVAPVQAVPVQIVAPAVAIPAPTPSRPRGDELIADLFEAVHAVHFQGDSIDAARFILDLAQQKIPSRAGMVHFYDIDKREYVTVAVAGQATATLLLRRTPEAEPLLAAAMRKLQPLVMPGQDTRVASALRFALLGDVKTVCTAPMANSGRFLGAIELIDPVDGTYDPHDVNALAYIAGQFAEFLAQRGVLLDPERIKPSS